MREIEVKFLNIDVADIKKRLKRLGAKRAMAPTLLKDVHFTHPDLGKRYYSLVRLRQEGKEVTFTVKQRRSTRGFKIEDEFEIRTTDTLEKAQSVLEAMGFQAFRDREKFREEYRLGRLKIEIDQYPRMKSYLEIEGPSKKAIRSLAEKLGFDFKDARGDTATVIIKETGLNANRLLFSKKRKRA